MCSHDPTIRSATRGDSKSLAELAELAGRPRPRGRALVVEQRGELVGAISLTTGAVLLDPRADKAQAAAMLRRRRYQLLRQGGGVGEVQTLLRRLVPLPA